MYLSIQSSTSVESSHGAQMVLTNSSIDFVLAAVKKWRPVTLHLLWLRLHRFIDFNEEHTGCETTLRNWALLKLVPDTSLQQKVELNCFLIHTPFLSKRKTVKRDRCFHKNGLCSQLWYQINAEDLQKVSVTENLYFSTSVLSSQMELRSAIGKAIYNSQKMFDR